MGVIPAFAGKRCLVAGATAVAGAIERRLAAAGADVHTARDDGRGLAEAEAARRAVEEAGAALGGLDVCVTAFGLREDRPFLELDDELWQRTLDANLKAAFLVGREAARLMTATSRGVIVHVGSDLAARPGPGTAAYAAAKAGVHLLATASALDLVPDGVRVCCVAAPESGEATALDADDVASAVAFCASDAASYVLGSTFFLDGPLPVRG